MHDNKFTYDFVRGGYCLRVLFMVVILAGLFIWAVTSRLHDDNAVSTYENRTLLQYTNLEWNEFLNGTWMQKYEDYSCEQIYGRQQVMKAYYLFLDSVGVKERNGYVAGKENYVFKIKEDIPYSEEDYEKVYQRSGDAFIDTLVKWKPIVEEAGSELIVLEVPHQVQFCAQYYPEYWESAEKAERIQNNVIINKLKENSIDVVETWNMLEKHRGEYIYYKTDHHYTYLGAYYVYQELLSHINTTYDEELYFPQFDECEQYVSSQRMVGAYLKGLGDSGKEYGDSLEWVIPQDMPEYERYESGEVSDMLLVDESINNYAAFMGNNANTIIKTNRPDLPNVLYIGRSYTNALELMSIYSFNEMHSIDPRYYEGNLSEYVQNNDIDYVVAVRFELIDEYAGHVCTIF